MQQTDCNPQTNSGHGQKKENQYELFCSSKSKQGREWRPNPEYETFYKLGSLIPQMILCSIFLYIYYNLMANYVWPLMMGEYKLENFDAVGLQRLFTQMTQPETTQKYDFSHSLLVQILSFQEKFYRLFISGDDYKDGQIKGIVIFIIIHILLIFLLWALYKTSITPPGNVRSSKKWEEEIKQFQENLRGQELSFLQMFEQKYSMTYLRNQRNSKTIPVHEHDLEHQPLQNQEYNMVFSEKNDSDNEGDYNEKQRSKKKINQLKEIQEQTDESNLMGSQIQEKLEDIEEKKEETEQSSPDKEKKQQEEPVQIEKAEEQQKIRKIDLMSAHSESEVVFDERDERQDDVEFLQQGKRDQIEIGDAPLGQYMGIYDQEEYDRLLHQLYKMYIEQEIDKKNYRPCKKCYQVIKPIRTHHCSQCKECILKMDHHCQWVDNCIGFYNYKYFLNMLFYATLALSFCTFTYLQCYLDACVTEDLSDWDMFKIALSFFFIITMNFFVFCFTIFHFWLIVQNKTTIEFCEKKSDSSKYDIGLFQNLREIFGTNMFAMCIPTQPRLEGDGAYFKLKGQN